MLRAINTATLSCCKNVMLQNSKASLSTLSFNPSLLNCNSNDTQSYHLDVSRINAVQSSPIPAALATIPSTLHKTYKQITSQMSNYLTTLSSGDLTLVTIDKIARKIDESEDSSCWEEDDVSSTLSIIMEEESTLLDELSIWQISTLKRRKKMMNKHKLRKRKKKMRLKTRK